MVVEKRLERLEKERKKIRNPELDREYELLDAAQGARWRPTSRCGSGAYEGG